MLPMIAIAAGGYVALRGTEVLARKGYSYVVDRWYTEEAPSKSKAKALNKKAAEVVRVAANQEFDRLAVELHIDPAKATKAKEKIVDTFLQSCEATTPRAKGARPSMRDQLSKLTEQGRIHVAP